jgi:pyruvate,water dikinase
MKSKSFILWFNETDISDVPLVGGKNASLGEMYQNLTKKGVRIPNGFSVTAYAYRQVLEKSGAFKKLKSALRGVNVRNVRSLSVAGKKCRDIILDCEFPPELRIDIANAYKKLSKQYKSKSIDVAVRSSATAEDLPDASFAGQQETFLNIRGVNDLLDACRRCFASLFTNRAIAYRNEKKFDHFKISLSIGVQKMVRSDISSAGVAFTIDTESGFKDAIIINGSYGLGESVVLGTVNPDEFIVFKPTLDKKFRPIISKRLGEKSNKIIYNHESTRSPIKQVHTPINDRHKFCITDDEILQLAKWAVIIEDHYSKKRNKWTPMDIEWAKDGKLNQLFIVQARPETVQSMKDRNVIEEYKLVKKSKILCEGVAVGSKIGQGIARVIKDAKDIHDFKPGEVLITEMTDPDWVPIMRIASAIVTNKGGRTAHAAIVSRELGIPCIVGTNDATQKIKSGQKITVSCSEGEDGRVYEGLLKFNVNKINLKKYTKPKTKVMMNIGNPDEAFDLSQLPNEGVGLAREEFIINEYIKIHPLALINYAKLKDHNAKKKIESMTHGYKDKKEFFVDKLSMGVGMIAAAFYPKDVILRFSDFKSNEYANLIGGSEFEPDEENPMIGWRGASRYYSPTFKPAFGLECQAIKKVREVFGLTNVKVMIPMCRTIAEGKEVLKVMKEFKLEKGKNGLQVYVMCELPSNVICADEFCKIFDGFSIGSNDLTQMTLGVDRDSALVSHIFNERNEAVLRLIEHVIEIAKKKKKKIGICGDAPSSFPEFAEFLVDCGIDSISLSPDAIVKTSQVIAKHEKMRRKSVKVKS